jgi:SAM-dependent methyltransferase
MEEEFESRYHRLEESNWWFVARRDMILRMASKLGKDVKILDVGCAGGSLINSLRKAGFEDVCGIDPSANAIDACWKRGIRNVFAMSGEDTSFPDGQFGLVIASDVLEHIEDDDAAVVEWKRILEDGGQLIVFVPAFGFLWSGHDVKNYHYRRYSKTDLLRLMERNGLRVTRNSYWNFTLFFPTVLLRFLWRNRKGDELFELHPLINNLLVLLLEMENWFLERFDLSLGVSVFTVAMKSDAASSQDVRTRPI